MTVTVKMRARRTDSALSLSDQRRHSSRLKSMNKRESSKSMMTETGTEEMLGGAVAEEGQ